MIYSLTKSSLFTLFAISASLLPLASSTSLPSEIQISRRKALDVWSPAVLTPNETVGWVIGTQANCTWDTSDAPTNISNGASLLLAKGGSYLTSGPGSLDEPLAQGFDLRAGFVEVTVPDIETGNDYQVILFGDSGNFGPVFSISDDA